MELQEYIRRNYKMPNPFILKGLGASDELIAYLRYTSWNTNLAILGQFLDEQSEGNEENWKISFEGEVTTKKQGVVYVSLLSTSNYINTDKIKVTFNGVEYECNKILFNEVNYYGGFLKRDLFFQNILL